MIVKELSKMLITLVAERGIEGRMEGWTENGRGGGGGMEA